MFNFMLFSRRNTPPILRISFLITVSSTKFWLSPPQWWWDTFYSPSSFGFWLLFLYAHLNVVWRQCLKGGECLHSALHVSRSDWVSLVVIGSEGLERSRDARGAPVRMVCVCTERWEGRASTQRAGHRGRRVEGAWLPSSCGAAGDSGTRMLLWAAYCKGGL